VAISIEPEILIIDETLSVGDVFFQNKCFRKFEELRSMGTSILFVSHDTNTVREMCSRVLWIEHGQQMMFADSRTVCNAYFNAQYQRINELNAQYVQELENEQLAAENVEIQEIVVPSITAGPESRFSDRVKILSVYVKDAEGKFTDLLYSDRQYEVGIVTQFFEDLEDVIIGVIFQNNRGMTCIGENTYEQDDTSYSFKQDSIVETTFKFVMPRIRSGEYELSPAVALGEQDTNVNLTWIHGASKVMVKRSGHEVSEIGINYEVRNRVVKNVKILDH
jgi:ABC-type Fe3+/spermidine/putrescine transport system ATPase subunit